MITGITPYRSLSSIPELRLPEAIEWTLLYCLAEGGRRADVKHRLAMEYLSSVV